jgi:phosphoribosylglycinamide formyltransferase 1
MNIPLRLGILGSTRGSNLIPLSEQLKINNIPATIELVLSNQKNAGILERARENCWPASFISTKGLTREEYDDKLSKLLIKHQVDMVILIGYMRILSAPFINQWRKKIINVHPSLLPAFSGLMDTAIHQAVLNQGLKQTGCTVHEVTELLDEGPILVQKTCAVFEDDTVERLKSRVQSLEVLALADAIGVFVDEGCCV